MKKYFLTSTIMLSVLFYTTSCGNNSTGVENADSTSAANMTDNESSAAATSSSAYAAKADSFRINSEAGVFLDPKTGKTINIKVDPQTGRRTNAETGEPVWRYVDSRTWWVYGGDEWEPIGEARKEGSNIRYKGENDSWLSYDERYPNDNSEMTEWKKKYADGTKVEVEKDGDTKIKDENAKIKTESDGDIKMKTENGTKVKVDEDGVKVKND